MSGKKKVKRLEARGAVCPVPTVMVSLALEKLAAGGIIDLLADDPTTRRDLVGWCGEFGHRVLGIIELRKGFRVRIQKCQAHGLEAHATKRTRRTF